MKLSSVGSEGGLSKRESERSGSAFDTLPTTGDAAVYTGLIHVLLFAIWIAICSVAPEFIWQGFLLIARHFSWSTVASALLVGAIVAFFVEPLTERLRVMRLDVEHNHKTPTHATISAFSLAILAVFAHDAIVAFASEGGAGEHAGNSLVYAISQVFQWAWIPLAITLAWIYARQSRWIRWTVMLVALASIGLVGPVFDWYAIDVVTTTIPCVCILFGGYYLMRRYPKEVALSRCTKLAAVIAIVWLASTGVLQTLLSLFAVKTLRVYTWIEYPIDVRFYLGWVIGLAVAPRPDAFVPSQLRRSAR